MSDQKTPYQQMIDKLVDLTVESEIEWKPVEPNASWLWNLSDQDRLDAAFGTEAFGSALRLSRIVAVKGSVERMIDPSRILGQPYRAKRIEYIFERLDPGTGALLETFPDDRALGDLFAVVRRKVSRSDDYIQRVLQAPTKTAPS